MLTWTTHDFSESSRSGLIVSSKAGPKKVCLTKRFCDAALNASTPCTCSCDHDESRSRKRARRSRSNAVVARSVSLFPLSWLRQHRRAGGANHDDVQSHGGKAPMALQRSLHQNHGFLPRASRPGGAAVGDLRWLPETQTVGRRVGRCYLHYTGCHCHGCSELAVCSLWQASSGNGRSLRAQTGG